MILKTEQLYEDKRESNVSADRGFFTQSTHLSPSYITAHDSVAISSPFLLPQLPLLQQYKGQNASSPNWSILATSQQRWIQNDHLKNTKSTRFKYRRRRISRAVQTREIMRRLPRMGHLAKRTSTHQQFTKPNAPPTPIPTAPLRPRFHTIHQPILPTSSISSNAQYKGFLLLFTPLRGIIEEFGVINRETVDFEAEDLGADC